MGTQNATITASWSKLADSADSPLLIQSGDFIEYQIAATDTDSPPTVRGHAIVGRNQAISRSVLGEGYVYARLIGAGSDGDSATLIVTGSSVSLS